MVTTATSKAICPSGNFADYISSARPVEDLFGPVPVLTWTDNHVARLHALTCARTKWQLCFLAVTSTIQTRQWVCPISRKLQIPSPRLFLVSK